jgi:hypothetical protein
VKTTKLILLLTFLIAACSSPEPRPKDEFAEFNPPPPHVEEIPKKKSVPLKIKKKKVKINPDGK